jgi:hypothetical protein
MSDADDENDELFIKNFVQDSKISNADSVNAILTRECNAMRRARIVRE